MAAQQIPTVPRSPKTSVADGSPFCALKPGELIYTGTREGVAAVQRGHTMRRGIDEPGELHVPVV